MDVIKLFKDVINFAQKSNDIDMVQRIISIQQDMLELQEANRLLKEENKNLKSKKVLKNKIERYRNIPVITLKDDHPKILYCANCYDSNEKIIQLEVLDNNRCHCKTCDSFYHIDNSPDAANIRKGLV